jgi:cobalt-zinc-cadmium efflux system outer membrane protein
MKNVLVCALALMLAGCAVQRYRPVPLTPAQTAARLESRTLQDEGLRQFLETVIGHSIAWQRKACDLRFLTLAAFYFNPDLAVARAQVEIARAGIQTARMRPNPVLDFSPGIPSPYLIGLGLAFPIITAGKRGYEIQYAKNISAQAEFTLAELAWKVRSQVRSALLNYLLDERNAALAQVAEQLQQARVTRVSEQLQVGEISRPELETTRAALLDAQITRRAAEGRLAPARAALAAAVGVPSAALDGVQLDWRNFENVPSLSVLTKTEIRRAAVLNRLDVRRALADYQSAQSNLQLEIARQIPNFQLGPGYQYEERQSYFTTSVSFELPIFNHNEGPIAQAEAQRKQAAANLMAIQSNVIAQCEQAFAQYRADYEVLQAAQAARANVQRAQVPMAQRSLQAGESDWLSLNSVLLESSAAEKTWIDSVFQTQAVLGQLEDAIQKPLEPEDSVPMVLPK